MKKVVWIDVGTHFGQEYNSIFGPNYSFYWLIFKRFLSGAILKRGKFVSRVGLKQILHARSHIRRRSNDFHTIFIEANPKIVFRKNVYLRADEVFNLALVNNPQDPLTITTLYLGADDELSQGSSIFAENDAVDRNTFVATMGVACDALFHQLKLHIEKLHDDYEVLLRLNCEGVEDEVIYSVCKMFGSKTKLICGSLNDIERLKGLETLQKLEQFMEDNKLPLTFFSPLIYTWPDAFSAIANLLDTQYEN